MMKKRRRMTWDAVSSSAASPVSSRGEDVQDQVEQDVTLVEQKEATEVIADVVMEKEQPQSATVLRHQSTLV